MFGHSSYGAIKNSEKYEFCALVRYYAALIVISEASAYQGVSSRTLLNTAQLFCSFLRLLSAPAPYSLDLETNSQHITNFLVVKLIRIKVVK